jgi:DNA polymerase-3 subunit epsilon
MRQVVLDTETTGLDPEHGHRVIEIGCVEIINRRLTNRHYHTYLNPEREVDEGAFKVHGISTEFLQDKPLFQAVLPHLIAFIDDAEVIIHNAPFDVAFLNAELKRAKYKRSFESHCQIFDTLVYAREKHPGLRNSLDALCKRYNIDNSNRDLHGALLDAEILAWVYLAMTGGQTELFSDDSHHQQNESQAVSETPLQSASKVIFACEEELARHQEFIQLIIKKSGVDLFQ